MSRIVTHPASVLREVSLPIILPLTTNDNQLVTEMVSTMWDTGALGLAANQIGVAKRLCVLEPVALGLKHGQPAVALVNPEIVWRSKETFATAERCLSFPGVQLKLERHKSIRVVVESHEGGPMEIEFTGLAARAVQHEIDHLDGKLIIDHVGQGQREWALLQMRRAQRMQRSARTRAL